MYIAFFNWTQELWGERSYINGQNNQTIYRGRHFTQALIICPQYVFEICCKYIYMYCVKCMQIHE